MNSTKYILVAVVYNNLIDTVDFCRSIAQQNIGRDLSVNCYLIDNSDDMEIAASVNALEQEFCFVKVLRPKSNVGYFGAFNHFFDLGLAEPGAVVVLCNNDLVFSPEFINRLAESAYHEDVFVVCPDVITMDGVHQNPHVVKPWGCVARMKLDLYFTHYYVACFLRGVERLIRPIVGSGKRKAPAESCYLHMGIGACYILLPVFLRRMDRLDYPFFLYGEEAYLTRQIHSLGGRLYYDSNLKVKHKESATLSRLPSRVTYEFGREGYWVYRRFY